MTPLVHEISLTKLASVALDGTKSGIMVVDNKEAIYEVWNAHT